MTDEYTPTTEQVLDNYVEGMSAFYGASGQVEYARQFDRWLAAHDAEIRAERDSLARLHEVATERTVQLAAVIERAKADIDYREHPDDWGVPCVYTDKLRPILEAADTDAALREVRAKALGDAAEDFAVIPHPYEGGVTGWLRTRAATIREGATT